VHYIEDQKLNQAKRFTEHGRNYYTVVTARETVYVRDLVVESDNDGSIDIMCFQNKTDAAQRARAFVRPGINTVPVNFLLPRVTFEDIQQREDLDPIQSLDVTANEDAHSQYTFTFKDVHPTDNCVRLTYLDYRASVRNKRLTGTIAPGSNGFDSPELIFRFGYETGQNPGDSFDGNQNFNMFYCFFEFRYETVARSQLGALNVPEHGVRYQITTDGTLLESGQHREPPTRYLLGSLSGLSYDLRTVTDPNYDSGTEAAEEYPLPETVNLPQLPNETDSDSVCHGFRLEIDDRVRARIETFRANASSKGLVDVIVGQFSGGRNKIFKKVRRAVKKGESKVDVRLVLDPSSDDVEPFQTTTAAGDESTVVRRTFLYDVVLLQVSAVLKSADKRWVKGYGQAVDSESDFRVGLPAYDLPDTDAGGQLPSELICALRKTAVVYDADNFSNNVESEPETDELGKYAWGPMFQIQMTYADARTGETIADVGAFTHGHLRADCLHVTADPDNRAVTDVRELQPLLTMAPGMRVGVNEQFPDEDATLHVGGNVNATGLGATLTDVLEKMLRGEYTHRGVFDALPNRALELVTEALNGPVKRYVEERTASQIAEWTNRALEMVGEVLDRNHHRREGERGRRDVDSSNRVLEMVGETLDKNREEERRRRNVDSNRVLEMVGEALDKQKKTSVDTESVCANRILELVSESLNDRVIRETRRNEGVQNRIIELIGDCLENNLLRFVVPALRDRGFLVVPDMNFAMEVMSYTLDETVGERMNELRDRIEKLEAASSVSS
jgi:hypothetical protein